MSSFASSPAGAAEAAVATKKKSESRSYTVLRQTGPAVWEFARNVDATSAEQAVRKAAEIEIAASDGGRFSNTYVATSRFVPIKVEVETKTQLKLS